MFRHFTVRIKRASAPAGLLADHHEEQVRMSRHRVGLGTSITRGKKGLGKTLLLVALGLPAWVLLPGVLAVGQTSGSVDTKLQTRTALRRVTIDDQVKRFAQSLDLSESQQSQVKKILVFQQVQARRIRVDGSISGAERISRFRGLQDSTVARIRAILNDEQRKNYNPLVVRQTQKTSPQPSVEDWMKAAVKQEPTKP